jgi:CRISPR-associated protein Cmr2
VPIYVGGDDVMAYLPLHTALQCISDLNDEFSNHMNGFSFPENGKHRSPTLSGALVIAHHLTPLSEVLETARRAEQEAKNISSSKNMLAIILGKRSGAERTTSAKVGNLVERMQVLITYVKQKQISAGTAYELQNLHQQLGKAGLPSDAVQREALRIIQRKRESGGEREIQKEVRQQFGSWLRDQDVSLEELAQEMVIAGELAKAYEMARVALCIGEKETQV